MRIIDSFNTFVARYRRYEQIRRELTSLNDRELSELGLGRYDIEPLAREAAKAAEVERAAPALRLASAA
ncbi:DUF1127 domain-containing protein [Ancylobacter sp. 6x-1]|uniref:DUF1127 domain-containing protein n=1 Tax=Ancylobacter crimeensis TaxID=2579147 RepID=A0ABT0DCF2_9HYPH|nr:DUF1127 domain-containing protein [Ancylobacter crimeensis]MCK0197624.1 DUF1127 domain-containing protein [Ancylobacter crimeensis]